MFYLTQYSAIVFEASGEARKNSEIWYIKIWYIRIVPISQCTICTTWYVKSAQSVQSQSAEACCLIFATLPLTAIMPRSLLPSQVPYPLWLETLGISAATKLLSFCLQPFCLLEYTKPLSICLVLRLASNVVVPQCALFVGETPDLWSNWLLFYCPLGN